MKKADFIRQMNDEDLAIFITQIQMDMAQRVCDELGLNIDTPHPTKDNTKDVFIMLQKEV